MPELIRACDLGPSGKFGGTRKTSKMLAVGSEVLLDEHFASEEVGAGSGAGAGGL